MIISESGVKGVLMFTLKEGWLMVQGFEIFLTIADDAPYF